MDSQVDRSSLPQDLPRLREGERVEVRQKDVGLRGSWHPGTIVGLKAGRRVVEYDELLADDGFSKLRETIPCAIPIEKLTSSPVICPPQKNTTLVANSTRFPIKRRGLLRPSPPICTEPSPLTWKGGLYVDVFYQDAWWEAVLLSDVTSLDADAHVDVMYPDEGDRARVPTKNLRISQFWDEVTGEWSIKGSLDLTRFLRRRGLRRKEVTLMVGSECRGNSQNNSTQGEITFCEKELTQACPSSDSRHEVSIAVSSSVKEVHKEPLLPHSHQHEVAQSVETDKDIYNNLTLTCRSNGVLPLASSPSMVCMEASMSHGRSAQATHEELQKGLNTINGDSMLCCNEENGNGSEKELIEGEDVGECVPSSAVMPLLCCNDKNGNGSTGEMIEREDVGECMPSPLAKEDSIYDNLRSKRRRIEDTLAMSCKGEAAYSCSQPTLYSPLQKQCFLQNHQLENTNSAQEKSSFGMEWSLNRCRTLYTGVVHNRQRSNLEGSSKCNSAKAVREYDLHQESNQLRKEMLSPSSRGILGVEESYAKEKKLLIERENNLAITRPVSKKHLLALAAPVQKSKEEYDQITSSGKAALDGFVYEQEVRPARQAGNEAPFRMSREKYGQITSKGKPAFEGGMHERTVRPGRHIRKELPSQRSQECDQVNLAGKASPEGGLHERALRSRKGAGKEQPIQKLQEEDSQIVLAGKAISQGVVIEVARLGRREQADMPSQQSREEYGQRISAGKEGPVEKSQEDNRIALAGKAMLEGAVSERTRLGRRARAEMPIQELQKYEQIISAEQEKPIGKSQVEDNRIVLAGKAVSEGVVTDRDRSGRRARAEMPLQESREKYGQIMSVGKAVLGGVAHEKGMRQGRQSGVTVHSGKSGKEYCKITSGEATQEVGVHKRIVRFGGRAGESLRSADKVERRGRKDTLELFKKHLVRQKQANALKRKASKMSSMSEVGGRSAKVPRVSRERDQEKTVTASLSNIEDKSLKCWAREIGKRAVMAAGFTVYYKPRRGKLSLDAVWTSPKGSSYWSLPRAWQALEKEDRKCSIRVEKAVVQQVLSKINLDDRMRSAFEKLDRFSGRRLQDVMRTANFTYDELTDLLLEDLGVLRKHSPSKKKKREKRHKKGRGETTDTCLDLGNDTHSKPLLIASGTSVIKKRGRKPKKDVERLQQEVDCRASTCKFSSSSKEDYVRKSEKNILVLKEGKRRTWLMGAKKVLVDKPGSLKIRNNLRGSSKSNGTAVESSGSESHKKKENAQKPRSGFRLEVRSSTATMDDESEDLSWKNKRTVASWMIDRGVVLEKERIFNVDQMSNENLKEGVLTREGILCRCCKKLYSVQSFQEHGGNQERVVHCNLNFTSGRSFLDCQLEAWNVEVQLRKTHNYKGVTVKDTNDDTCLLCGDGGDLLCCDLCPSTFHASCLQLDNVPEGNWYCPKCRCGVCRDRNGSEEEVSMAVCRQCEHRYHIACLCGGHTIIDNNFFCGHLCRKIYTGLRKLMGVTHSLDRGFSWTLLHCMGEGDGPGATDIKLSTKNNSKLAVALLVLKECFNPMDDPRTNIDMITHAIYNRWSEFDRLNYVGFYTAVLEKDDEIISVASIRIHGARVAEMPLIGTRHKYRRQGMCRLLVGVIEKLLCSLEVGTFILPAIPELFETWTKAFGFRPLNLSQRSEIKDLSMMVFPGTDLLQKPMPKSSTGNTAGMQICNSDAELLISADVDSQDGCQKLQSGGLRQTENTETDLLHYTKTECPSGGGSLSQIPDLELHQNDDDVFFDASPNLQSTDSSMIAETGMPDSSSGSPPRGCSASAEGCLMRNRDTLEPDADVQQTHRISSGDSGSMNVEGFLNESRDYGSQKLEVSSLNDKGFLNRQREDGSLTLAAKSPLVEITHVDLQKTEQNSNCKPAYGGHNNSSLTADRNSHDSWNGRLPQSELSYYPEETSPGGVRVDSGDCESLETKTHSAEPVVIDSKSLVGGNLHAPERLENVYGFSNPSSDSVPALSGDGGSLDAIAPLCEARINESLRPEPSTIALGSDAPIAEHIEHRASITHRPEPSMDPARGVSVISKGSLFINASENEMQKLTPVNVETQNFEAISDAHRTDPSSCGGSSVETPLIEEGIVACKS